MMDGWDDVGRSVSHAVFLVVGASVAVGSVMGAGLALVWDHIRHRHRES